MDRRQATLFCSKMSIMAHASIFECVTKTLQAPMNPMDARLGGYPIGTFANDEL